VVYKGPLGKISKRKRYTAEEKVIKKIERVKTMKEENNNQD